MKQDANSIPIKTYLVGGAVRDRLLGLPVSDLDYVVVGATPAAMEAAGFVSVGRGFPVYLHPLSKDEYALARTERKTSLGYRGFVVNTDVNVTLEEDLGRRDLTVNAIAVETDTGGDTRVIDPYGGQADLEAKVLRHVSPSFAEDPVRILRVARFAARYTDFSVAHETMALMATMVKAGEVDALVPERVWSELAKGLMEQKPSRMFEVLRECGALARILPELDALWGVPAVPEHHPEIDTGIHVLMVLDMAAKLKAPLSVRFACLCHDFGKGTTPKEMLPRHHDHETRSVDLLHPVCDRLKVPSDCRDLAVVVAKEHGNIHGSMPFAAGPLTRLLQRCDAIRQPRRFVEALLACECDARGRLGFEERPYPQRERLLAVLKMASSIDAGAVAIKLAALGHSGEMIAEGVHGARVQAVAAGLRALAEPGGAKEAPARARRSP